MEEQKSIVTESGVTFDTDGGEILDNHAVMLAKAKEVSFTADNSFVHVRNDCSASGGCFKVGANNVIARSINATLIAARQFKDAAPFTKKGEEPKPQDWVQVLFVDNKYGNLKSTLIKTRSIGELSQLINAAKAVNESPVGINFTMRFLDAEGQDDKGQSFKYKFLTFEREEEESKYKSFAVSIREKLEANEIAWPSFDNELN